VVMHEMSKKIVNFAVVGCGNLALRTYIPYIVQRSDKAKLVATCDIAESRAKRGMEIGHAKEYYTDFDEMLEKADIDAVVIVTDISSHASLSVKAARAGKHILTQKSMASSLEDAIRVVREVRKAGVKCVVEPSPHLIPWKQKAKELIEKGVIGKVCYIHDIHSHGGVIFTSWPYKKPGNVLFDMGVYGISDITYIMGPAKRVIGAATVSIPKRLIKPELYYPKLSQPYYSSHTKSENWIDAEIEDNTVTVIDFGNGTLACVESNYCTLGRSLLMTTGAYGTRFHGVYGTLILTDKGVGIYSVKKEHWNYSFPGWFIPQSEWSSGAGVELRPLFPEEVFYMEASLDHLIDCILNDKEPLPNVEWGCHVTEIMVKSLESARTGKALDLTTTF